MTDRPVGCSPGEVHVWHVPLFATHEEIVHSERILSDLERTRADRFRAILHRNRYVIAHGALRKILSRYLGIAPEAVTLQENANGKPQIQENGMPSPVRFSLSHSEDHALVAVSRRRPVGVDLERIGSNAGMLSIAERFFSMAEQDALRSSPQHKRLTHFFRLWVCKEAYVKARGEGIIDRLPSFSISIEDPKSPRLLEDRHDPQAASRWRFDLLDVVPGFAAALVSDRLQGSVRLGEWPGDLGA